MKPQTSDAAKSPICLCTNLRRSARAISHVYDVALAPTGIKITQFSLLRAIERSEPVAISVLADEVALDRTTLARNLSLLERDQLVALSAGDDQRVTEVTLTRAGRAKIVSALPIWTKTQKRIADLLSPDRIEQLRDISQEISAAADAHVRRAGRKKVRA